MARVTPAEAAQKLSRRLQAATADITKGINAVTEAPGIKAAASAELMLARLIETVQSGVWAEAVSAVSLQDWKTAAINKGVPRIAQGIQTAEPKLIRFYTQLLPAVDAAVAKVQNMPNLTLEDRIARSAAYQREMANFKFRRAG